MTTFVNPCKSVDGALGLIPDDLFLEHLQQVPAGWNAKLSHKIDDRLSWEAIEEQTPAEAIMVALLEYKNRDHKTVDDHDSANIGRE
jgi:hypothetical protein